jgi:cyclopropane fatty-acyl-phospholipid synthase-like methyltransferase
MTIDTTSRAFFDALYERNSDPWNFTSSSYELGRYKHILHALPLRRYRRAFEPGCSIGVLTEQLASVCDRLEAIDISGVAVDEARLRCRHLANVHIRQGTMPEDIPDGDFDLIVFSEIGYYFEESHLASLVDGLISRASVGATFIAVHWLGSSRDHLLSGDRVHEIILGAEGVVLDYSERHAGFRLDRWVRQ